MKVEAKGAWLIKLTGVDRDGLVKLQSDHFAHNSASGATEKKEKDMKNWFELIRSYVDLPQVLKFSTEKGHVWKLPASFKGSTEDISELHTLLNAIWDRKYRSFCKKLDVASGIWAWTKNLVLHFI